MLNDRKNSVFTEQWPHEHLIDLIIVTGGLKAIEKNVPSSSWLLKKNLSAEVKNQGAL